MAFKLAPLPYGKADLEPVMSERTVSFHYDKHHAGYVNKLNQLVAGTPLENMPLEEVIRTTAKEKDQSWKDVFNNAGQAWNHDFYWRSMKPGGGGKPTGELAKQIDRDFGSYDKFLESFVQTAVKQFGSGWAWLVLDNGTLKAVSTHDAEPPMITGRHALLTCDVWEHAYYLDYQNLREKFVRSVMEKLANWDFAAERLKSFAAAT